MAAKQKTVIIIGGPTAVGKTAIAIEVAKHFQTAIISADSRQCFHELKTGVARPSEEELAMVKHYFIASHSIHDKVNAIAFEHYALEKAAAIFQERDVAVMVGGTGLYIKAFCDGLDDIPEVPDSIRDEVLKDYRANGMQWLQERIKIHDPDFYSSGEIQNPQRLMRALEVYKATGKPIGHFRRGAKAVRSFAVKKIALHLSKEQLHHNINSRVDKMMEGGLEEEVRSLLPHQHINALQTVGYRELFDYFNNKMALEEAVEAIKLHTRQYAKRQMTWFKKDAEWEWVYPNQLKEIIDRLNNAIQPAGAGRLFNK